MGALDLVTVAAALGRMPSRPGLDAPPTDKAAVAAVLRDGGAGAELLFIRRAEHPRDPWSGQMGLPGGRVDPGDGSPLAAVVRETREELGFDLERAARRLARLTEVRTHLREGALPRSVVPFAFALAEPRDEPAFVLNHEVAEAVWVPLAFLADEANRESFDHTWRGTPLVLPCYHFGGRKIWGLTLWIVDELLAVARAAGATDPLDPSAPADRITR